METTQKQVIKEKKAAEIIAVKCNMSVGMGQQVRNKTFTSLFLNLLPAFSSSFFSYFFPGGRCVCKGFSYNFVCVVI